MKKTEKTYTAHKIRRIIVCFILLITVMCNLGIVAFAEPTDPSTTETDGPTASLDKMNDKIYTIYKLIRNSIAFPLLALSFASCGFKILGASFIGSGNGAEKGIQAAKEQLFISICALILLLILPYLITWGLNLFRDTAWTPPDTHWYS